MKGSRRRPLRRPRSEDAMILKPMQRLDTVHSSIDYFWTGFPLSPAFHTVFRAAS